MKLHVSKTKLYDNNEHKKSIIVGIYRFDFSFQKEDLGYGASWHPSMLQHRKMAAELLPFLRKLMNWN